MMIIYGMAFIFIPYDVAFHYGSKRLESSFFISSIIVLIDIVCLMDIAINFNSSYVDSHTKEIVLDKRKIIRNYLRGYFWIDLLSSIPDRLILA
ncbi:CLUMA_CG019472, isoform A, partial [Clunio marinus]